MPLPKRRTFQLDLQNAEWFDLEVKQYGNSKTVFETAKAKQENVAEWNYLPPMGHCSDIVKYKSDDGENVIAIISIGGQDWKDPNRAGQISADIFMKDLLVNSEEVSGLGPFRQVKSIKAITSKQTGSMCDGCGSMIRPLKNASFNVFESDSGGDFCAVLAFGEFLEAGGWSNLTSNNLYKIEGNVKDSNITDVSLYLCSKPEENDMYGSQLPEKQILAGHKPQGRRGQTGTVVGTNLILYIGGVEHCNQLIKKKRLLDPFLLLDSEKMNMIKLSQEGVFNRAHHSTQYIKNQEKVIVCGGMLVPENPKDKVSEFFEINNFSIFKIDIVGQKVVLLETVKIEVDIPGSLKMQAVSSAVFGSDLIFIGGFVQPFPPIKFNQSLPTNQNTFMINFEKMKSKILDRSENGKTAQGTLHVLDANAVALVGGSIESLKIFTNKNMTEEQPCCFGDKCKVYNKSVRSEIEKLEISCDNHTNNFSHVLCDPDLKFTIPRIKKMVRAGQPISYSCPVCKGSLSDKRKKK